MLDIKNRVFQHIDDSALTCITWKVVDYLWFPGLSNGEIMQAFAKQERLLIVMDKNVLSYCQNALFKKDCNTEQHRSAIGILLLSLLHHTEMECTLALIEGLCTAHRRYTNLDAMALFLLTTANPYSVRSGEMLDFALGLQGRSLFRDPTTLSLPDSAYSQVEKWLEANLNGLEVKELYDGLLVSTDQKFLHHMVLCLKIAEIVIRMEKFSAKEKMMELLKWIDEEYIFVGSAIALASKIFTKAATDKKWRMFENHKKVLEGCRNWAFDIFRSYEFRKRLEHEKDTGVLFATFDKRLTIALNSTLTGSTNHCVRDMFIADFGEDGGDIYNRYDAIINNRRPIVLQTPWDVAKGLCQQLE